MDRLTFMLGLNIIKEYSHMFFFPLSLRLLYLFYVKVNFLRLILMFMDIVKTYFA